MRIYADEMKLDRPLVVEVDYFDDGALSRALLGMRNFAIVLVDEDCDAVQFECEEDARLFARAAMKWRDDIDCFHIVYREY